MARNGAGGPLEFAGTRDQIRQQILQQKDMPDIERKQLPDSLTSRDDLFMPAFPFNKGFYNEILILFFPPVALKAKWFVLILGGIELWAGVTGSDAGVAHFAHLGGMLFGFLLLLYWRDHPPTQRY